MWRVLFYPVKIGISFFLLGFLSYATDREKECINSALYKLPPLLVKKYFYQINHHNRLTTEIIREIGIEPGTNEANLSEIMRQQEYYLIAIKERLSNGTFIYKIMVSRKKIGRIYTNPRKEYIKIKLPLQISQDAKKGHLSYPEKYTIWKGMQIAQYNLLFYHYYNYFVLLTNIPINYVVPTNHSPIIHHPLPLNSILDFNYLILPQKKLWFIQGIFYKYKKGYLLLKIFYSSKIKVQKITTLAGYNQLKSKKFLPHSAQQEKITVVPNHGNIEQTIYFLLKNGGGYYLYKDQNPKILSYNNICFHKEKEEELSIKQDQLGLINKFGITTYNKPANVQWDMPFVTILAAIHHKSFSNKFTEIELHDSKEKSEKKKETEKPLNSMQSFHNIKSPNLLQWEKIELDNVLINKDQEYFEELNHLKKVQDALVKHDKKRDLYPVLEINFLRMVEAKNFLIQGYINMILSFFYGDYDEFKKHYKEVFFHRNLLNIFLPVVNIKLTVLNEETFWHMIYILPEVPLSSHNIILMMRYSYLFPSVLRDKIKSFII